MKIKLRQVVAEFLDSADSSSHAFRRLYNIGIRGLREFNMDIVGALKTVILDISPNKTANLPPDYIAYSKIGIINERGEVATFKRNDQLSNLHQLYSQLSNKYSGAPGLGDTGYITDPANFPLYYWNYWNQGTSFNLFGTDSGTANIGEYKVDDDAGVILLNPQAGFGQIVLEYLSDGYDCDCEDYEIDIRASEALICYIRWKNAQDLRHKFGQGDVRVFMKEYYRERKLAKMRMNSWNVSEMEDIARRSRKLVAKA